MTVSKTLSYLLYFGLLIGATATAQSPTCSSSVKNAAVNQCVSQCADIGECIFGCEIGGINNVDTCSSSCTGLGTPCLNACLSTVNAITAGCAALQVTSFSVLFGSTSYPITSSSPADLPWEVAGIQVVFSEPVASGSASSLSGLTALGFSGLGTNTLTWTLPATPIASVTTVLAATGPNMLSDANGNALRNGNNYSQPLNILWGDVNADGAVTASDMVLTNNATTQPYNILYDVNGDGVVNVLDVTAVRSRLITKLP